MQRTTSTQASLSLKNSCVQLPNLVLAGAPKCGTSSLFNWLAAHPEVCGSVPKETFYFMDVNHPLQRFEANYPTHELERYQFFPTPCSAKIFIDATTHYLYQETALSFFAACEPQPYVIFILRNPSDRILSSFNYTQNNLSRLDQSVTFDHFVNLLLKNNIDQLKEQFYSEQSFFILKQDLLYSQYYDFLIRWAEYFSSNRLKIILFEQMKSNPRAIVTSIARDLGIDASFYNDFDFQQKNQTVTIRNSWLHRNLRQIAPRVPKTRLKTMLKSFYFNAQKQNIVDRSIHRSALERLDRYFDSRNQKLEQTFNLDLSCWKR